MPSKGTTNQRGYDARHRALRKQYLPLVRSGKAKCWRCGQPIKADAKWDLGHLDGTDKYAGPEHVGKECPMGGNRATKGRGAKPEAPHTPPTDDSRAW